MELLTKSDLMRPPYNMTVTFIRKHGREMGGDVKKGRPIRYPRPLVDAFIKRHYLTTAFTGPELQRAADDIANEISRLSRSRHHEEEEEMTGRGGRR